jgi:hypothetical protein
MGLIWYPLCTRPTDYLDFYSAGTPKLQSAGGYVTPFGHIILISSQPAFALTPYWCMLSKEATHFIVILIGPTRPRDVKQQSLTHHIHRIKQLCFILYHLIRFLYDKKKAEFAVVFCYMALWLPSLKKSRQKISSQCTITIHPFCPLWPFVWKRIWSQYLIPIATFIQWFF